MRYPDRATVCISSQAGCGMACPFCATGQGGLTRNLSTAEIVDQVRAAAAAMRDGELTGGPGRLSNVVFMGMGEPLANYQRVVDRAPPDHRPRPGRARAVATVGDGVDRRAGAGDPAAGRRGPAGHPRGVAARPGRRAARHAGPGEPPLEGRRGARRRRRIMPTRTGRRYSIEYALIRDVNDQPWRADLLGRLLRERLGALVHVNLIPLNPTPGSEWDASPSRSQEEFVAPGRGRRGGLHRPRHPRPRDRRRLRPARGIPAGNVVNSAWHPSRQCRELGVTDVRTHLRRRYCRVHDGVPPVPRSGTGSGA